MYGLLGAIALRTLISSRKAAPQERLSVSERWTSLYRDSLTSAHALLRQRRNDGGALLEDLRARTGEWRLSCPGGWSGSV